MATKTITLEIDAYERLKRAKLSPQESFSSVVRRARFDAGTPTIADLLIYMKDISLQTQPVLSESQLNVLEATQQEPRYSDSKWHDSL